MVPICFIFSTRVFRQKELEGVRSSKKKKMSKSLFFLFLFVKTVCVCFLCTAINPSFLQELEARINCTDKKISFSNKKNLSIQRYFYNFYLVPTVNWNEFFYPFIDKLSLTENEWGFMSNLEMLQCIEKYCLSHHWLLLNRLFHVHFVTFLTKPVLLANIFSQINVYSIEQVFTAKQEYSSNCP